MELKCLNCGSINWNVISIDQMDHWFQSKTEIIQQCNNCSKVFQILLDANMTLISLKELEG